MRYNLRYGTFGSMKAGLLSLFAMLCLSLSVQAQKIIYVSPTGTGDGSNWTSTTQLSDALSRAEAGDEIWLKGFDQITDASRHIYVAPDGGWVLPSGVRLYGGFEGIETDPGQRKTLDKAYQMTFRSILSGDIAGNDTITPVYSIFSENKTRSENAVRVLAVNAFRNTSDNINDNSLPTVVDGLTISGGHGKTDSSGGGICVKGGESCVPYAIERCYFINNYAAKGGAIYVEESVKPVETKSLINQCVVYNNAAGVPIGKRNLGGGICIAGAGNIVNTSVFNNENGGVVISQNAYLINSTVARNTGGGVDMTATPIDTEAHVYNSVVWGNSFVYSDIKPYFSNSAYQDALEENGNINISENNQGNKMSPRFDAPSIKTSFDTEYDWRRNAYPLWSWKLLEGSWLINKGNNIAYENFANGYNGIAGTDLSGQNRIVGNIDMSAYEFQAMPAERIRYVRTDGSDSNDGLSWNTAYKSVQKAINELAAQSGVPGEVWIAEGEYEPSELIDGPGTPASFRMYDGISLYGGFDRVNPESNKSERKKGTMPWQFENETVLQGSTFNGDVEWNDSDHKWSLTSASTHVVWFAPLPDSGEEFRNITVIEGITIEGGQAKQTESDNFDGDKGAGVYINDQKAYLLNSVVRNNVAPSVGGGIYLKDGRVQGCLVYNNSSETDGGGIYVDNAGLVLRCMLTNNSALNGGGIYLDCNSVWEDGRMHPNYQILSSSVVTNNTSVYNGAVYCNKGGIILHTTIANNYTPTATDAAAGYASQTGGLYIDSYAKVISSVLWNNKIKAREVQLYASNPSGENVGFYYSAIANMQSIIWNNIHQQEIMPVSGINESESDNGAISPGFEAGYPGSTGVQASLTDVAYFWKPVKGSNLRARGMSLGLLPAEVLVAPELDIEGKPFNRKPSIGAHAIDRTEIVPEEGTENGKDYIRIYVNVECTEPTHDGSSWDKAYRSLNEAVEYMAGLTASEIGSRELQIYIMQGDLWPRYVAVNLDPQTATVKIPEMAGGSKLVLKGGFSNKDTEYGKWAPLVYRSQINGNHEGKDIRDGLYHCITVEKNARVEFDGFHIINGYAAETANLKYGAGMLVRDGAQVTVKNTIFENNTAIEGAAIDARGATLELVNCVINNNTNNDTSKPVVNALNLTMHHVSVVNNLGAAPANIGTSSFAAGNTSGNTFNYASVGEEGYKNFANPTNGQGATLGFDTYLGGYSNFAPLTSSIESGNLINKATGTPANTSIDIAGNERSLGGSPDLGAYEADLPKNGDVIYVTQDGAGKMDGSSWENAIAGNLIYDVNNWKKVEGNVFTTDPRYIGFYDANSRPYAEISGASKLFFEHLDERNLSTSNVNYKTETHNRITHVTGANSINIRNERKEQYVGGLQYAVELAAYRAIENGGKQKTVWVAGGVYSDYKGFVIRDKVDVLGGFPNEGTPGENDRHPLISQYVPASIADTGLDKSKYETIIQIQSVKPWVNNSSGTPGANPSANLPARIRKPVLFQPDVCLPTKSPSGRESSFTRWSWSSNKWKNEGYGSYVNGANEDTSNKYRYNSPEGERNGIYREYTGAKWDGFTIRHGFYTDYKANRDGGAGVRMFRGVTLQNCVVTDNYINAHNEAGRGAGIYCDGDNSKVVNCFILNNANSSDESYGGGMYMILGVSYNTMVANNYAKSNGGGIFIEDAMFYNNTVAYNRSNGTGGLHQWTASSGTTTTLKLYNTIFYGNSNKAIGVSSVNNFNGAWNCYVSTASTLDSGVQNKIKDSRIGVNLTSPFEDAQAQTTNNYRLNAITWCLNNGEEDLGNDYQGNPVILPYTDVDFTDRIKDCTVDIGAYERLNQDNVKSDINGIYYVTENGAGNSDASSLDNAACAMKLQEVLYAAGERVEKGETAIVRIAGYEGADPFVYRANTLSNPDDPQSYSFVIPYGVIVEGGYDGMADEWNTADRNPKKYRTILSAKANEMGQEVNGYHTVTFGEKPSEWAGDDKTTVIDGIYIIDGKATSMAGKGNPNTRGGGAIVPAWGHVRNCVVANCEAVQGGALYLMPGATVSGSLIMENKADDGAGIYADNDGAGDDLRSHMISNTITDNDAVYSGGGIYYEDGALLTVNSVIWGNTASSDKNVCGAANLTFGDTKFESIEGKITEFYPFNNSYVETYELPSNFENTSMKSEENFYFTADRTLKAYSELIKHGIESFYQEKFVEVFGISDKDMKGTKRIQEQDGAQRIDVGAYAFEGGMIPLPDVEEDIVTDIFVNKEINESVSGDMNVYIGRSFYTSLSWLDDALDYILEVRKNFKDVRFNIYLAQGTYKPSNRRVEASTEIIDQRQNSYVIPAGVNIYGGFKGDETFSFGLNSIDKTDGTPIQLTPVDATNLNTFLNQRTYSDLNNNGVNEPWEMEFQSILSGDINVSPTVKSAYHVLFSSEAADGSSHTTVVLDGLTIKDGETWHVMSSSEDSDERGRGGAIYTNGVDYFLKGCRLMNCKGVRGGAVYVRDANLTVIGSAFSGNGTVDGAQTNGQDIRGGAVYVSGYSKNVSLKAVNTLWANNETAGKGGAIATSNDLGFEGSVSLSLMNNTIVRNRAEEASAIYSKVKGGAEGKIVNTVIWGGEETGVVKGAVSDGLVISNSASETVLSGENNIRLNAQNMAIDGPRFVAPSKTAGLAGWNLTLKWNPASVSLLTDAGDGELDFYDNDVLNAKGEYRTWWSSNGLDAFAGFYMGGTDSYERYKGQKSPEGCVQEPKIIDIGLHEYQYKSAFGNMNEIFVDVQERGDGSGDSWANATSDLRGAIVALSDPTGGTWENRIIHIRGGAYPQSRLYVDSIAYQATMNGSNELFKKLTIKGSYAENGNIDFSTPTVFMPVSSSIMPDILFYAKTNGKDLEIEGVTFNGAVQNGFDSDNAGGNLKLKNVAFRNNKVGADINNSEAGNLLMANVLFADGTTGLKAAGGNASVVNATFAKNSRAFEGDVQIYNTVSWMSGSEIVTSGSNSNINLGDAENDDILNGPNFVDPDNGNYMIRPSMNLLDAADRNKYDELLGTDASVSDKDLANNVRLTGEGLDIGAYEYNAPLNQIVYVKTNVATTDGSGSSWENPIKDLQGAVDLASVYANKNTGKDAYVFVHRDVKATDIRVGLPRVKIYGGMNDENGSDFKEILDARKCIISSGMSTVEGLNLSGNSSLVDGFLIRGNVTVDNAMLSTSVLEGNITTGANGIVYNSYLSGTLAGAGKAVNVTSSGTSGITNKINVTENAVSNRYITADIWKYQLNEDSELIDNAPVKDISEYISMAGHSKDLSASPRIRNAVDPGCFETWLLKANETLSSSNDLTENHVVYVCKNVEFDIARGLYGEGRSFNVGFLLLEHGAGLRSNGNTVGLTNFAVERNLDSQNSYWDMSFMPFDVIRTEGAENVAVMTYDGAERARYDYKFSSTDGAWKELDGTKGYTGMLMQSDADAVVRMYGNSYIESAGQKGKVQLMRYNNMEPWASKDDVSQRFTHLENMSWNMFGSPFLCAMNYDDMEYGRVIYKKNGDTYSAVNTMTSAGGSVEAGSAVFTQTATLQTSEIFSVNQRTGGIVENSPASGSLVVAVSNAGSEEVQDEMSLTAVPGEESSAEFNIAADGVKMMTVSDKTSQIYIERGGKRYSLLSAVDIEGTVAVGLNIKEPGLFSVSIPEECEATDYETVILTDKSDGRTVDLLDGAYEFVVAEAGDITGRFTIQFNRMGANDGSSITVYTEPDGIIVVEGLAEGMTVRLFDASGKAAEIRKARSVTEKFTVAESGVYLVQIIVPDAEPEVFKAMAVR